MKSHLDGRTCLIATHRPAMLALVERLIVLEGGRVRLDGPKASVMAALSGSKGMTAHRPDGTAESRPA